MSFLRTTAINKLLKLKKRRKIIQGGTSAGKTFGILPILIDKAAKTPNLEISVVSKTFPHLRRGAMKDFLKVMKMTGRFNPVNWSKTSSTYYFANGSYIEFFSVDVEDKVRGARRDILYVNEANRIDFETYNQLQIRTNKEEWLDFNPTNRFWAHEELPANDKNDWLILTYLDNEALHESIIESINEAKEKAKTSKYWDNWYRVYGLGLVGKLEGVIFNNWEEINNVPERAVLKGLGIDFGYTNDPTVIIEVWEYNGKKIYNEVLFQRKLKNNEIAQFLSTQQYSIGLTMVADSSEPKSIDEINSYGWEVVGAVKGKDSINYGIDVMQQDDFLVTSSSENFIKELENYAYDQDREGNRLNKPIDKFNHGIDAARYITTKLYGKADHSEGQVIFW